MAAGLWLDASSALSDPHEADRQVRRAAGEASLLAPFPAVRLLIVGNECEASDCRCPGQGTPSHDHAAAATLNADGQHNYLEQSVFVDELTADSAHHLHVVSARAWRQAFRTVMREAQARYDHDQKNATAKERVHRARFGAYFYAADKDDKPV